MKTEGFLLVATIHKKYLTAAQFLADSLKEYTNHSVTLFTEDDWVNDSGNSIFDNVYGGAPKSSRAKLWALDKTPYDVTCYLDSDMICQSNNAQNVFDLLEDNDIVFGKIEPRVSSKIWWKNKMDVPHGGMFVWKNSKKMKSFMNEWWKNWIIHQQNNWRWGNKYIQPEAKFWDQFPLQIMLLDDEDEWFRSDIKWSWIKNHHIWNWIYLYDYLEDLKDKKNDLIFCHYTLFLK